MGQYYNIAIKDENGVHYNQRKVRGCDYIMSKLMEHSWIGNEFCDAVSGYIYNHANGVRLLWCGDYAESDEVTEITRGEASYDKLWYNDKGFVLKRVKSFDYKNKFLVNHDKKIYLSFDKYIKDSSFTIGKDDDWCIYPVSLLTALGNGRGGGDFLDGNIGFEHVGSWAWDLIGIIDEVPKGYVMADIVFKETL